jgi:hypothetical protein
MSKVSENGTANDVLRRISQQLNGLSEGRIANRYNAVASIPTTGSYQQGDFVPKSDPTEAGTGGWTYIVAGWICTVSGTPGTFEEFRVSTGAQNSIVGLTGTLAEFNAALTGADFTTGGGTATGTNTGDQTNITGNAATVTTNANLTGDVTSVGNTTTLTNAPVIAKVLTGYVSGAGTVSATDSILQAIQKLNGNDATNANLTGPITSAGNATAVASQTGTGSTFVMSAGPTMTGTTTLATLNSTVARIGTTGTIDSAGEVVSVDGGANSAATFTGSTAGTQAVTVRNSAAAGTRYLFWFEKAGGAGVGSITHDGTNTAFNTASDAILKSDRQELDGKMAARIVDEMPAEEWLWSNGSRGVGFVAQECAKWMPEVVTQGNDLDPSDKGFKPWQVDYSKVAPYLWAALRETRAELDELRAQIKRMNIHATSRDVAKE